MKKILYILLGCVALVLVVGIIKFNFINDDIFVESNGKMVREVDVKKEEEKVGFSSAGAVVSTTTKEVVNKNEAAVQAPNDAEPLRMWQGDYVGTVVASGFVTTSGGFSDCNEGGCDEGSSTVVVVHFMVINSTNTLFNNLLAEYNGNYFAGKGWLSLGCLSEDRNKLESYNDGNFSEADNLIVGKDLEAVMNSTPQNPIKLQLTKPYHTGGRGASTCYAHFRNFKVITD